MGSVLFFSSDRKGQYDLYEKAVDGSGNEELVLASEVAKYCQSWSSDDKFVLFMTVSNDSSANLDLWTLPLVGERKPVPYLQTEFAESGSRFSSDGKWVAYASDESGKNEVYVSPFRGSGGKQLVSASGGSTPVWRWRRQGNFLFRRRSRVDGGESEPEWFGTGNRRGVSLCSRPTPSPS